MNHQSQRRHHTILAKRRSKRITIQVIDKPCSRYLALHGRAPPRPSGGVLHLVPTGTPPLQVSLPPFCDGSLTPASFVKYPIMVLGRAVLPCSHLATCKLERGGRGSVDPRTGFLGHRVTTRSIHEDPSHYQDDGILMDHHHCLSVRVSQTSFTPMMFSQPTSHSLLAWFLGGLPEWKAVGLETPRGSGEK